MLILESGRQSIFCINLYISKLHCAFQRSHNLYITDILLGEFHYSRVTNYFCFTFDIKFTYFFVCAVVIYGRTVYGILCNVRRVIIIGNLYCRRKRRFVQLKYDVLCVYAAIILFIAVIYLCKFCIRYTLG